MRNGPGPWGRIALLAALLAAAPSPSRADETRPETLEVSVSALPFDADDAARQKLGRLRWRGGLELRSDDDRFGGLSGLLVSSDGRRLLAVTDKGHWLSARLAYDGSGRLSGFDGASIARLKGLEGEPLSKKKWRDAEALALAADGAVLVSFEREHRVWRYGADGASPALGATPAPWPDAGLDVPKKNGLEALVALSDDRLLALTQNPMAEPPEGGFLWQSDGWSRIGYAREEGFKTRGASRLPGGDVLVLETVDLDAEGTVARLLRLPASGIRPGAQLEAVELARLGAPLPVEKFEGVAARRDASGRTLVYLLSDDDFDVDARTLLLLFELAD